MNYKLNSVIACFSLPEPLDEFQLQRMLEQIKLLGFKPIGRSTYNEGIWTEQRLLWSLLGTNWAARFRQVNFQSEDCTTFALDLDSNIFLPGSQIFYSPNGDPKFLHYRNLLAQLLTYLNPIIGKIDYDADLICSESKTGVKSTIASWGNFFPLKWLNSLDDEVRTNLVNVVDEYLEVNCLGILTFIHPLKSNQAWSSKHERLDKIIRRYFFF